MDAINIIKIKYLFYIEVILLTGEAPREADGTRRIQPPVDENTDSAKTDQPRLVELDGKTVKIRTKFLAGCLVGKWKITVQVIASHILGIQYQ